MPDDNAHLLEALRRAIHDRDADGIAELLHPEAELRLYSADEPIVGREAARAAASTGTAAAAGTISRESG